MVIAVLETHCGVKIGANDVYLNIAGGLRIVEPAADLAVAAALVSSLTGAPLPQNSVYFGEVSLSGAIRSVTHTQARLKESEKLGFTLATVPDSTQDNTSGLKDISINSIADLTTMVARVAASAPQKDV
jgi:DNA repair protein RadA/Sms